MVNFGPLTAETGSVIWGIPPNVNGFCVLAALLHGTLVVGAAKLCGVEQRAPPIFGRVAITLDIGPHSSMLGSFSCTMSNRSIRLASHLYISPARELQGSPIGSSGYDCSNKKLSAVHRIKCSTIVDKYRAQFSVLCVHYLRSDAPAV